jgi:hypothetical protein
MTKKEKQQIPVFDLNFAAFQLMNGNRPDLIQQGSRVIFLFTPDDNFYHCSAIYHSNSQVNILDFVSAIRQIRAMMLTFREGQGAAANEKKEK